MVRTSCHVVFVTCTGTAGIGSTLTVHRPNHGLQTAYEFGEDIGGLDPSVYFGFRKDLYHFDHFMYMLVVQLDLCADRSLPCHRGQFQAKLPQLMDVARYEVVSVGPEQGVRCCGCCSATAIRARCVHRG